MLLYTFDFFVFFTFVFVLFWKVPKKFQWALLLLAGYYFYASYKPAYLGLIIFTTLISYLGALLIDKTKYHKKHYLIISLLLNLSVLFIFKYFNFFSLSLNDLTGLELPNFKFLLPIGISFYTLQIIGYLADVYRGKIKPEKSLKFFALFACFFPQISAGPIERASLLLPQLKKERSFDYQQTAEGAKLFAQGLFKKMVIADNLAIVVDRVFNSLPEYKGLSLILVIIFFSWQIYMDFSGYTDMARGIAKMVGINLMENFNLPYFATSIRNFWKKWHISLSSWLKDYLYIPLGGNRKGLLRTIVNTLIVFTISGLWHGASWNFVLWGFLHGLSMSIETVFTKLTKGQISIPQYLKLIYAYSLVSLLWVFFRAPTINDALYVFSNAFIGIKNFLSPTYIQATIYHLFDFNQTEAFITFFLLALAITMEILQRKASFLERVNNQHVLIRFAIYSIMVFLIIELRNAQIKEFIYTQF